MESTVEWSERKIDHLTVVVVTGKSCVRYEDGTVGRSWATRRRGGEACVK